MNVLTLNANYYLNLFLTDNNGDPKNGLSVTYSIYKSEDNSLIVTGSLVNSVNGMYNGSYLCNALGQFYIIYTTPTSYTDEIESIYITSETAKATDLARLLGLSDENKRILNTVHDSDGNITDALVKIYSSASDFENDINELATYEFSAAYNANGLMQTMGIKRLT